MVKRKKYKINLVMKTDYIYVQPDGNMVLTINNEKTLTGLWGDGKRIIPLVEVSGNDLFMIDDQERFEMAIEDEEADNGIEIGNILDFSLDDLKRAIFVKVHGTDSVDPTDSDKYCFSPLYCKYFPKDTMEMDYTPDERLIIEEIIDDIERYT